VSRKRLAPARWVLPVDVNPPDSICFQIPVPNDPQHIAAFLGAIYDLAKPYNWANDAAHTAIDVGAVWLKIFLALRRGCPIPKQLGYADGDDFMIRQNPDNPCLLENSVDGITWCTWADLSLCLSANPAQPTGGGVLTPGECRNFRATLDGNGQWLLPVPVSAGYTIELSSLSGGWTDGGGDWNCPNGQSYILGACSGVGGYDGSDPLPSALHAQVIFECNGSFFNALSGVVPIPGGTPDDSVVTFQMNDATLSDNFGTVGFNVKVCAASVAPISLTYLNGSGPATANIGDTIIVNSETTAGDQHINMVYSRCVKVSLLGFGSYAETGSGANVNWAYLDCASVEHDGPAGNSGLGLTTFPVHVCVTTSAFAGAIGSPYAVTIKIEDDC